MSPSLLSCAVCLSAYDPLVRGSISAGIFVLLGVTALVLSGFALFILRLIRRSQA